MKFIFSSLNLLLLSINGLRSPSIYCEFVSAPVIELT